MSDLWVKLERIKTPRFIGHAGNGAAVGTGHQGKTGREFGDLVAVAHPDLEHAVSHRSGVVLNSIEQSGVPVGANVGMAKLAFVARRDYAAELYRHGEHPVANSQNRNAEFVNHFGGAQVVFFVGTGVATGKNNAFEQTVFGVFANPFVGYVAGMDFTKNVGFANASGNELRHLGAEI